MIELGMIKPVLLWSDALILLLLVSIVVPLWLARRNGTFNETFRAPWRQVMASRMGRASTLVLVVYVSIGLLDSLHYVERLPQAANAVSGQPADYGGEVLSLLDAVLTPLRTQVEKTYSAPFATHLYAKETMQDGAGREVRDYPRLLHGGAHLADPARDFYADVAERAMLGLLGGWVAWLLWRSWFGCRGGAARFGLGRETCATAPANRNWALLLVLLVVGVLAALAPHYHVLGTDKVGQDVLYLSLKSIRTGLLIGTLTTLIMLPFALALGIAAGYFGGRIDDAIQYLYTTLNSIPGVLLIAAAVLVVQVQIEAHAELFTTAAERSDVRPDETAIRAALPAFTGEIMQTPPAFSAIKVDGERAYDLARAGETVVLEPRPVFIEALTLLSHTGEASELEMTCEKGTYVRALARDLARALGTRGHVVALHRAQVGPFSDVIAVSIEDIERNLDGAVVPIASGLIGLPEVRLSAQQAQVLRHGNPVLLTGASAPIRLDSAWASEAGAPVALGYVEAGHFHPQRVLLAGS